MGSELFSEGDKKRVQEYFNNSEIQKGKTPDLNKLPRDLKFTVVCSAGITADTPILLAGDESGRGEPSLTTMKTIFSVRSGKNLPIFAAIRDKFGVITAIMSHMVGIPKEVFINKLTEVTFSNGFGIECANGTQVMKNDGNFVPVKSLNIGDKVLGMKFSYNGTGIVNIDYEVTNCREKTTINQPVYLFMAEHENMLVPHIIGENEGVEFICIKQ